MKEMCKTRNDSAFSFMYDQSTVKPIFNARFTGHANNQRPIQVRKTEVKTEFDTSARSKATPEMANDPTKMVCPVHPSAVRLHSLNECMVFSKWTYDKRKELLMSRGICFKCCETTDHLSKDCKHSNICNVCKSNKHPTAMYNGETNHSETNSTDKIHGGESTRDKVNVNCTSLYGEEFGGLGESLFKGYAQTPNHNL